MKRSLCVVMSIAALGGLGMARKLEEAPQRSFVAVITPPQPTATAQIVFEGVPQARWWVVLQRNSAHALLPVEARGEIPEMQARFPSARDEEVALLPTVGSDQTLTLETRPGEWLARELTVRQRAQCSPEGRWSLETPLPAVGFVRVLLRNPEGEPLRSRSVEARLLQEQFSAPSLSPLRLDGKTDAEGRLTVALFPGWHQLRFFVPGAGWGATGMLQVQESGLTEATVPPLVAFVRIQGTVPPELRRAGQRVYFNLTDFRAPRYATAERAVEVDSHGGFVIDELPLGEHPLLLRGDSGTITAFASVRAGKTTTVTFRAQSGLSQPPGKAADTLRRPRSIEGKVHDASGKAITDAEVFVQYGTRFQVYSGPGGERGVGDLVRVQTDPTGHFRFSDLPESYDTVTVFAYRAGGPLIQVERQLKELSEPFVLTFPLRAETLTVTLLTPEGKPAVGVPVQLGASSDDPGYFYPEGRRPRDGGGLGEIREKLSAWRLPKQTSDAGGIVRFTALMPGSYSLGIGERRQDGVGELLVRSGEDKNSFTYRMAAPRTRVQVPITEKPVSWGSVHVAYRLRNMGGGGNFSNALFTFAPDMSGVGTIWDESAMNSPERHGLLSRGIGWQRQATCLITSLGTSPTQVALTDVWLGAGGVRARVVDAKGKPVAGVALKLTTGWGYNGNVGTSDVHGEVLFRDFPAGRYQLQVMERSWWDKKAAQECVVFAGEEARCQVVLESTSSAPAPSVSNAYLSRPRRALEVRCVTDKGAPVWGAGISVGKAFRGYRQASTDGAGKAILKELLADVPVELYATMPGFVGQGIAAPGATVATLVLKSCPLLQGRVTLAGRPLDQFPAGRVSVQIRNRATPTEMPRTVTPQADGQFLCALPEGSYELWAVLEDTWVSEKLTVQGGGKTRGVALTLPRPGQAVTVTLKDKKGKPCSSVSLDRPLTPPELGLPELRTDRLGRVTLVDLPAGKHTLRVRGTRDRVTVVIPPAL